MAQPVVFQGISSGINTDALVKAIIAQEGLPLERLKARQTLNTQRATALKTMQTNMKALATSLIGLSGTSFDARNVSSSDANNTYVAASATGAAAGTYDVAVTTIATKGRLHSTDTTGTSSFMAASSATGSIFSGSSASFAIKGTDGVVKTVELTADSNSLNGLRDAINASGAGVTASVVNIGKGANPYQLVLNASSTGTGSTSGVITLADITSGGPVNTIGVVGGTYDAGTGLSGGTSSSGAQVATDAVFTVNGIQLTRSSNTVTDVAQGLTFTLRKGGQDGAAPTTFTISQDKSAATNAMQDVLNKFNTLLANYKSATASSKDSEGNILSGPLTNDSSTRLIIQQLRSALTGGSQGYADGAAYTSTAQVGVKTAADGTLSLDTRLFQEALEKDPQAVKNLFSFTGTSTSASVAVTSGTSKTVAGSYGFSISSFVSGGAIEGTLTIGGSPVSVTGSNGVLTGPTGTALEGLQLAVSATGSGTLSLTRGAGQTLVDLIGSMTALDGTIFTTLSNIDQTNLELSRQIDAGKSKLDRRAESLRVRYANMEKVLGELQAAGQSLAGLA